MQITLKKVSQMTLIMAVITLLFSCNKDSDLLLDAVINEPEIGVEDPSTEEPSESNLVSRTYTFSPINDAYVQENQGYDRSIVRLQENYRTSYLMFDLSEVNGAITKAVLQFSVASDEGDGSINVHKGDQTNWTEENLTVANAPQPKKQLASLNKEYKVGLPQKVTLDFNEIEAEKTTLVLTHNSGNDLAFASKEHPSNEGPQLVITYMAPEDSPEIGQSEEEEEEEETDKETEEENGNTESTENTYFVSVNGSSSNDGRSEANAWSIEHAFENATAGDIVYIKAGNYGNKELLADNSGTSNKPIKFIGYTNTPGDIVSNEGSTFTYGDTLDPNKMPLLTGAAPNGEGQGTALKIVEPYVQIENFQITQFKNGLYAKANNGLFKNIIVSKIGDYNPNHTYPTATSNKHLNYTGLGFIIEGDNIELHNSFALNCGAQGITFQNGSGIKSYNNKVYADNNINPTDYYFLIGGGTVNSLFKNTFVHRVGALTHLGHGIVAKGQSAITGNIVDEFSILNTFLEVQFPKTTSNIFKNGRVEKEANVNARTRDASGMRLANGARNNHYENIILTNCSIKFSDWNDGLAGDVNDTSDNNTFLNIQVKDAFSAIAFSHFLETNNASSADNNTFTNCSFSNIDFLFEVDRANSNTRLIDCTIDNVRNFKIERIKGGATYQVDASYQNCHWSNLGFTKPN